MQQPVNSSTMLRIGTILRGTYRIDSYLSSGGFGNTYVATNTEFDERVAIKEFFMKGISQRDENQTTVSISNTDNRDSFMEQKEKFKKEARRLRRLHNKHIVGVHDLFEENGTAYYVMDYVDGENLAERLKRAGKPLEVQEVRSILPQVLDALKSVHDAGLWHLDLKPANIMVDKNGHVLLIDFGASKQLNAHKGGATTSTAISYTNGYAPREQMEQNYDKFGPWTDIYALGATLYNLLTNRRPPLPTDIDDDESQDKHMALPFPDGIDADLRELVLSMMKTNRLRRPQNVNDVMAALMPPTEQKAEVEQAPKPEEKPKPQPEPEPEVKLEPEVNDEEDEDEETLLATPDLHALQTEKPAVKEPGQEVNGEEETSNDNSSEYQYEEEPSNRKYWIIAGVVALLLVIGSFWYHSCSDSTADGISYTEETTGAVGTYYGPLDDQGRPSGNGKVIFFSRTYQGEFYEGAYFGKGVMTYSNGDKYEGEFHAGSKSGNGTFTYSNGEKYEGEYSDDTPHGKGVYTWPKDSDSKQIRYEGNFDWGEMTGQGKMTYANGDVYEGAFEKGKPHGDGIMYYANHTCKDGKWSNGTLVKVRQTGTWE